MNGVTEFMPSTDKALKDYIPLVPFTQYCMRLTWFLLITMRLSSVVRVTYKRYAITTINVIKNHTGNIASQFVLYFQTPCHEQPRSLCVP